MIKKHKLIYVCNLNHYSFQLYIFFKQYEVPASPLLPPSSLPLSAAIVRLFVSVFSKIKIKKKKITYY